LGADVGARGLNLLAAAVIAVLAPVAGYVGAETYLHYSLQQHLASTAEMVVQRIDGAIDRATASLRTLAASPEDVCGPQSRDRLRLKVFNSPVLKEVAVFGPDDKIRCSNNVDIMQMQTIGNMQPTSQQDIYLSIASVAPTDRRVLRVIMRRDRQQAFGGLIPVELFVPSTMIRTGEAGLGVQIEAGESIRMISEGFEGAENSGKDTRGAASSRRYPVRVLVAASGPMWRHMHSHVYLMAIALAGAFGLLIACLIVLNARRRGDDPIAGMHRALERGEFIPYYQPIVDIDSGRICGCEVLVRWRKADGQMIPPGSFIGEAERSGFIFPLTLSLMRQAAAELGPSYALRPSLKCGFNLCAAHFQDDKIVDDVQEIFQRSRMSLNQVLLEVTERDALPDMDTARTIIASLQAMGVRVALDDVGTGHGGMSYLLKLGVDVMKIDKLFIDALGAERQSTAIVDSLIDLAAHLGMDVVAEGVETFAQVEALRRRGVRQAQGYVFSPPLPGSSFVQLVEAMEPPASEGQIAKKALRG
jgi:sensor c-di-GMP phosphodiesterase-like protein